MIRVALLGVSHWHLDLFLPTLVADGRVEVVGVHDPAADRARAVAQQLGCSTWSSSSTDLLDETTPDFALALGSHDEMSALGHQLLDRRIPFAMEKPCGTSSEQVWVLARRCEDEMAFAAVPFVWRQSELLAEMRRRFHDDAIDYLSLRWIAGPPSRYVESGCEWMLDPRRSGGGCTINLGVHLIDLARHVLGPDTEVVSAVFSDHAYGLPIEDHSVVLLRSGGRTALVETGYLLPGPHSTYDMRFSIKTRHHYLIATGPETVEVVTDDGRTEHVAARTTNVPHYPVFVRDTLDRLQDGRQPLASMTEMAHAMDLVQEAYRISGRVTTGHSVGI